MGDDIGKYLPILWPLLLRDFDFGRKKSVETALSFLRFGKCLLKLLGGIKLSVARVISHCLYITSHRTEAFREFLEFFCGAAQLSEGLPIRLPVMISR